jgi:hypothetical protein
MQTHGEVYGLVAALCVLRAGGARCANAAPKAKRWSSQHTHAVVIKKASEPDKIKVASQVRPEMACILGCIIMGQLLSTMVAQ